ncbi:MAG: glycosyltransferase family 39 protein [Deltaproteobacteria bacterium]|nr:glycosyltransferase family 39 protein [Deltaproteobacteria bacterium]
MSSAGDVSAPTTTKARFGAAFIAATALIAFGAWVRFVGLGTIEFWADEADWAIRAEMGTGTFIRPLGYLWLAQQLVDLHNSELMLRLPSFVAGVVQLPLFFLLLKRLVVPSIAVMATAVLAVHPVAVGMSKEFKPYALEACLHTALLLLVVALMASPTRRAVVALGAFAAAAPLLSWSIVFAYPGAFLVTGLQSLWQRRRTDFVVVVAGAGCAVVVLGLLFWARLQSADRKASYWGSKYGVFFNDNDVVGHLQWLAKKTADLAAQAGELDVVLPWLTPLLQGGAQLLCVVGIVTLLRRRRWWVLLLLLLPLVTTVAFNVARQWPYGPFRTNLYLLSYLIVLAAVGADGVVQLGEQLRRGAGRVLVAVAVVVGIVALPWKPLRLARKGNRNQTAQASVREAMNLLRAAETAAPTAGAKPILVLDGHACTLFRYYRDHHARSAELRDWFLEHVDDRCSGQGRKRWYPFLDKVNGQEFWLISAQGSLSKRTLKLLHERCRVTQQVKLRGTFLLHCGKL